MKKFISDLEVGEIHARDLTQFELKSEFLPSPKRRDNHFIQEFYLFIPNALQINRQDYQKNQFFRDLTNLIRYKTPEFTLSQIIQPENSASPLFKAKKLLQEKQSKSNDKQLEFELKLLGNVIRSSLREKIGDLIYEMQDHDPDLSEDIQKCCEEVHKLRNELRVLEHDLKDSRRGVLREKYRYIDEFISINLSYVFTALLEQLRLQEIANPSLDRSICEILHTEKKYRIEHLDEPVHHPSQAEEEEFYLYRAGMLNKFVLDALLLSTQRTEVYQRFQHIIGAVAAAVAMFIFLLLFIWGGEVFVINSLPFVVFTVLFYVLKDRIKETLKVISYRWATNWLYDYKTEVRSPEDLHPLGSVTESFSFVDEKKLPEDIITMRNRDFHDVLECFKRPEQVIYYKKEISLKKRPKESSRRDSLNIISRFNISKFLHKADDPLHPYLELDTNTDQLVQRYLPKVYHLNIILRNHFLDKELRPCVETKKFRLILDKSGIKRVEQLNLR